MADERIELIAKHIIKNHDKKTNGRKFCSILAVQSIPALIKYYDKFKELKHDLKIGAIFTFQDNEDLSNKKEHSRDSLEKIIKDYNYMYKEEEKEYSTDTFEAYFENISNKIKNSEIDIVIVVNMLLTGFDSKPLNTLYVDKNLKHHGLIQAFSRTNRVLDATKPYGNIVCYRNLKKETDEAICLFSKTETSDVVLMQSYEHYLELFKKRLETLYNIAPTLETIDMMQDENDKKAFVESFKELTKQLTKLKTFTDFEFTKELLGISEQEYEDYKSKYLGIYDSVKKEEKTSILADIDFGIELMETDKINVSYILNLLRNIDFSTEEQVKKDVEKIRRLLDKADNENLRLKSELIREFLEKVVPKAKKDDSMDELFNDFIEEKRVEDILNLSNEVEIKGETVKGFISEYEYSGKVDSAKIKDSLTGGLLKKRKLSNRIKDFIIEHVNKFTF